MDPHEADLFQPASGGATDLAKMLSEGLAYFKHAERQAPSCISDLEPWEINITERQNCFQTES